MKKLLLVAAAAVTLAVTTVPASAQVRFGADPWGAGVQVGPFGLGVGPSYGWRDRYRGGRYWRDGYGAYGRDCHVVRERVVTPSGRVIFRTHRTCDW